MKKLVWAAAALLGFAIVFPDGISFSGLSKPDPTPAVVVDKVTDSKIVELLADADKKDKARIASVYSALASVLKKDNGQRINTTEKWAELHASTLGLAIDSPGKYPGLDVAIEDVFYKVVGTEGIDASVVNPVTPLVQRKLIEAANIIAASAK